MLGWKTDQFELIDHMNIEFDDMFARYKMRGKDQYKKAKPGIMALLKHKESQRVIVLTNSHFEWDPKKDFIKYGQSFWLLKQIQEFYAKHSLELETVPLIVTGDFNSMPICSGLHLIMGEVFDYQRDQSEITDMRFKDDAIEIMKTSKLQVNNFKIFDTDLQSSLEEINQV